MASAADPTDPPSSSMALAFSMPTLNRSSLIFATTVHVNMDSMESFKDRLRHAMQRAGYDPDSPSDVVRLAAELKVTRQAVQKVLDERSKSMSIQNAVKAAHSLGCDPDWLVGKDLEAVRYLAGRGETDPLDAFMAEAKKLLDCVKVPEARQHIGVFLRSLEKRLRENQRSLEEAERELMSISRKP